jgi:Tfp pilus assembly protein PilN
LRGLGKDRGKVDFMGKREGSSSIVSPEMRKGIVKIGIALAVLLFMMIVAFFVDVSLKERRYGMLKSEVRQTFVEAFPDVKGIVNEVQQAEAMIKKLGERGARIGTQQGTSYLDALREIAQRLPEGTKIVALDMDDTRIDIRGIATSFSLVDEAKKSLLESPSFGAVTVGNIELTRRGGQGVLFKMVIERSEA